MGSKERKIPIRVGLELPPDFCNYTYKFKGPEIFSDCHIYPLGKVFCDGAEMVSKAAFTEVVVTSKGTSVSVQKIAGTLIPQFIKIDIAGGPTSFGGFKAAIMIKWIFTDNSGKMVWVNTSRGESRITGGIPFTSEKRLSQSIEMAIDDLFQKSLESILSSYEIRRFAGSMTNDR